MPLMTRPLWMPTRTLHTRPAHAHSGAAGREQRIACSMPPSAQLARKARQGRISAELNAHSDPPLPLPAPHLSGAPVKGLRTEAAAASSTHVL